MNRSVLAVLAALLLPGCAPSPEPDPSAPTPAQREMYRHFGLARDLRVLAVSGDLDRMRVVAGELARTREAPGLPPDAGPWLDELRVASERVAAASAPGEAAWEVAGLAATCGRCHLEHGTDLGTRFLVSPPLLDEPSVRHPNFLSWVSRLLWDGLVGPSDTTWDAGIEALSGPDPFPPPEASHVPADEVARAEATLREVAAAGRGVRDLEERAELVGRMWDGCAGCHAAAGVE